MQKLSICFLCIAFILGCYSSLFGQLSSYDISNYNQPNLYFKSGTINFNSLINNSNERPIQNADINSNSLWLNRFGIGDYRFIDAGLRQFELRTNGIAALQYTTNSNDSDPDDLFTTLQFDQEMTSLWFNQNNLFFEFGHDLFIQNIYNNLDLSDPDGNKFKAFKKDLELELFVGHGQPQVVNDAWHAITILEFLHKQKLTTKSSYTDQEIDTLAKEIGLINFTRNTDPRLEKIAEVERLTKFLYQKGYVSQEDYRLFAHLEDAWEFENFRSRLHGLQYKIGLRPSHNYEIQRFTINDDPIINDSELGIALVGAANKYNAVSIDWQLDWLNEVSIKRKASIAYLDNAPEAWQDALTNVSVSTDLRIGHYPTRRTYWELNIQPEYGIYLFKNDGLPNFQNNRVFRVLTYGQYVYYFSPRFNISLSGSINLRTQSIFDNPLSNQNFISFDSSYRLY